MVAKRHPVGAHYGLTDWLIQRLSAVVMVLYTALVLGIALWTGGIDYALWRELFDNNPFKLASFLFMVSLLYHAWIGMRDVYMDYLKPVGVRLAFEAVTVVVLVAYLGWTIQILWGSRG